MKSNTIIKLAFLIVVFSSVETYSQSRFGMQFGLANPLSDFASEDIYDDRAGLAAHGFNLGLKYHYQFSKNGIGLFSGLDFNYNSLAKDCKNDIKEVFKSYGIYQANYTFYKRILL